MSSIVLDPCSLNARKGGMYENASILFYYGMYGNYGMYEKYCMYTNVRTPADYCPCMYQLRHVCKLPSCIKYGMYKKEKNECLMMLPGCGI